MARQQIAAGNWKMNLDRMEAEKLAREVIDMRNDEYRGDAITIMGVPYPFLASVSHLVKDHQSIYVAAQNMHQEVKGAYTGEVAAPMLVSLDVTHVILGHSERRQYFGEDEALLATKVDQALAHGLKVIYCLGEVLEDREDGRMFEVVERQLKGGLFHLPASAWENIIVAYEPVWAIGTGRTASPEQAQEVHNFLRELIRKQYDDSIASSCPILYGGSVNPGNAENLFGQADIDGGLVGGASLKSRDFTEITKKL
jgi:triosephosphate isomerase